MIKMQGEHPTSNQSPFDNPGLFFPDTGRQSALTMLQKGINDGISLITCTGKEGTGKTALRRMLEKEYATSFLVISFPSSVESFDYALQVIALKLNLEIPTDSHTSGAGLLLLEITQALREQKKRLLILFDEAEKLYLATLERIRKMIDLANEDGVALQVILFGRTGLQPHMEQLSLCTFKDIKELHVVLPALTQEDVFQYLNFCMQQHPDYIEKNNIFSREVAAKILEVSLGNFKKINSLAWDSLQSSAYRANDPSFMVLLEHVRDIDTFPLKKNAKNEYQPLTFLRKQKILLSGILLVLLTFIFQTNKDKQEPAPPTVQGQGETTSPIQPSLKTEMPDASIPPQKTHPPETEAPVAIAPPETTVSTPQPPPELPSLPQQIPPTPSPVATPEQATIASPTAPPQTLSPADPTQSTTEASTTDNTPQTVNTLPPTPGPDKPHPTADPKTAATVSSVDIAPLIEEKTSVSLVLRADKQAKKNMGVPFLTAEQPTKNKMGATKPPPSTQLPRKNLAAGENWLTGKKDSNYTIQLMVLTGNRANEKLSEILNEPEHKNNTDDFIILKKSTSPSSLMLFLGEYPNRAAAREALTHLPPSLQKYTPYAVSVKQAVEKSKQ